MKPNLKTNFNSLKQPNPNAKSFEKILFDNHHLLKDELD